LAAAASWPAWYHMQNQAQRIMPDAAGPIAAGR
jgi:hypothetical protein